MVPIDKISFFIPHMEGGGEERIVSIYANYFSKKGYQVDLLLVKKMGNFLAEVNETVNIINLNSRSIYFSMFKLRRYLRETPPDLLVSTLVLSNLIVVIAKKLAKTGTKIILRENSTISLHERSWIKKIIEKALVRKLYKFADKIIAVSKGVEEDLRAYAGVDNITTLYNPIINASINEKSLEKPIHKWLDKKENFVIIGIGRLDPVKNFPLLLQAFSIVQKELNARLIILGEGVERTNLLSLTKRLGIQDHVDFPGFQKNPYKFMKNADLVALSSNREGLPSVLIEALAVGCPVISTDCCSGPAEILDYGKYGHLSPVNDLPGFVQNIRKVYMGEKLFANDTWLEQFQVDLVLKVFEEKILHNI